MIEFSFSFNFANPFLNQFLDTRSSPSISAHIDPFAFEIAKFLLSAGFPKDDSNILICFFLLKNLATLIVSSSGLSRLIIIS